MAGHRTVAPTTAQVAQAHCLTQCTRNGFLGCTWNGEDACIDADAAHFHEDARHCLEGWMEDDDERC
jgi:hypothetical protein